MKERGILFSAPMVRALLAGRKTQTRRLVRDGLAVTDVCGGGVEPTVWQPRDALGRDAACPYGEPGDRLWVRETWQYAGFTEDGYPFIRYRADDSERCCERIDPAWSDKLTDVWATLSDPKNYDIDGKAADRVWRPAIFLPRWASRITLEVTDVRVERLQDISEEDAGAEGIESFDADAHAAAICAHAKAMATTTDDSRAWFAALWDSINGKRAPWSSNPWLWVVAFRVLQPHLPQPSAGSGGKPTDREGGDPPTPGQQPHRRLPDDDDS